MKLYKALISAVLVLCLSVAYATANPINCGSDEGYHTNSTMNIEKFVAMNSNESSSDPTVAANMSASVSNAVSLISNPTSENCIDNTQKVTVYIASMTTHMHSESTGEETTVAVTYDPLTTAMLFEYNPDYLSDSNIATNLTKENTQY